jgi:hypothetical protein
MKEKIKRSWEIFKACGLILKKNKKLLIFPTLNLTAITFLVFVFYYVCIGVLYLTFHFLLDVNQEFLKQHLKFIIYFFGLLLGIFLVITIGVFSTFLSCAQTYYVLSGLRGRKVSIGKSLRESLKQYKSILAWVFLSFLIAPIILFFKKLFPWIGNKLAVWMGITTWGVGTFFVIPILVFEKQDVKTCLQKSFSAMKSFLVEQIAFQGGIQILSVFLTMVPIGVCLIWLVMFSNKTTISGDGYFWGFLLVYCAIIFNILGCFRKIYCAVLYTYATTDMLPNEFKSAFFNHRQKK